MSSFTDLKLNFGSVTMSLANYIELEDLNPFSLAYKRYILKEDTDGPRDHNWSPTQAARWPF